MYKLNKKGFGTIELVVAIMIISLVTFTVWNANRINTDSADKAAEIETSNEEMPVNANHKTEDKEEKTVEEQTEDSSESLKNNNQTQATDQPVQEKTYPEPKCLVLLKITPPGSNYPWKYEGVLSSDTKEAAQSYRFLLNGKEVQESPSPYYSFNEKTSGEYTLELQIKTAGGYSPKSTDCSVGPLEVPINERYLE